MYDELKESLRECCGTNSYICNCENCIMKDKRKDGDYTECVDALGLAAADAIEKLNEVIKHQAEILHRYGGETGIRQSVEMNNNLLRQRRTSNGSLEKESCVSR